jgi:hypothetical protein
MLVGKTDLRETGCEDGRWIELAQHRAQWQTLVLTVLKLVFCCTKVLVRWILGTQVVRIACE